MYGSLATNSTNILESTNTYADNNWHLVDLVASPTSESLYVDGQLVAGPSNITWNIAGSNNVEVGVGAANYYAPCYCSWPPSSPVGSVAGVSVYDSILPQSVIDNHFSNPW